MKRNISRVLLLAGLPLAACNSQAIGPTTSQQVLSGRTVSQSEVDFATYGYQVGTFDRETAKLAATNGASPAVLAYANDLVAKADQLTPQLYQQLADAHITPPAKLSPELSARLDRQKSLTGAAFDRQYLVDQIFSHEASLPVFQQEAATSQDPTMKALAQKTSMVVDEDLQKARDLLRAMDVKPKGK